MRDLLCLNIFDVVFFAFCITSRIGLRARECECERARERDCVCFAISSFVNCENFCCAFCSVFRFSLSMMNDYASQANSTATSDIF